ncbi:MAG: FecR family protein [Treponema sp.]|nr:FecR family protein [Treponema sp.]
MPKLKNRFFGFVFCAFALFAPLSLAAQEGRVLDWQSWAPEWGPTERAFIYHAEGGDFSLTIRGEQTVFSAEDPGREVIVPERFGIIQTGAGTSLEIQLIPSGTVLRLSENTSVMYNGFDENGRFMDFGLLYGRIRVVSGETGMGRIGSTVIRNGGISARVAEGDIGVDYVLEPAFSAMPLFRLYAFRGRAEVFSHGIPLFDGFQMLTVEAGESVSLDLSEAHAFVERGPLGSAIINYWAFNNFAGYSPLPMPNVAIAAVMDPFPEAILPSAFEMAQWDQSAMAMSHNRRALSRVGFWLIVSSVAIQSIIHYEPNFFSGNSDSLRTFMYGPLGTGLLFSLMGMRNPQPR